MISDISREDLDSELTHQAKLVSPFSSNGLLGLDRLFFAPFHDEERKDSAPKGLT